MIPGLGLAPLEPLDIEVRVRAVDDDEVAPLVHFPRNDTRRWACGQGIGGPARICTARAEAVTCRACKRTRAYRAELEAAAAAAELREAVNRRCEAFGAVRVTPWLCPLCEGSGDEGGPGGGGASCLTCAGSGLVDHAGIAGWPNPKLAPRPAGVRRTPCKDCRFRPGSQETEAGQPLPEREKVFFCHQGMPEVRGAYVPVMTVGGLPVGALVCGGWWDIAVLGKRQPLAPAIYPADDNP